MTRLDRLAENQLQVALDGIERNLRELKVVPQTLNVVNYVTKLPPTYDWQDHIPDPSGTGFGGKQFQVQATATTMEVLWANIYVNLFKGSPPVAYFGNDALNDLAAGNDYFLTYIYDVPNDTNNPAIKSWFVNITGDTAPLLSVKFTIEALDNVAISITELN